jgi:hypothetical protein
MLAVSVSEMEWIAEGMLDHLAPPVENFRSRFQSRRHAVEHRLVFQTRDLAIVLGAARLDRANDLDSAPGNLLKTAQFLITHSFPLPICGEFLNYPSWLAQTKS